MRAYSEQKIDHDVLGRLLEAASLAPSCFNSQPWRFIIFDEEHQLDEVRESLSRGNQWARKAPCIIAAAADYEDDCRLSDRRDYALYDTGSAVENLLLQAFGEGLYAHPMAGFDPLKVRQIAQIPEQVIIPVLIAVGYPGEISLLNEKQRASEEGPRKERRPMEDVVFHGSWGSHAL